MGGGGEGKIKVELGMWRLGDSRGTAEDEDKNRGGKKKKANKKQEEREIWGLNLHVIMIFGHGPRPFCHLVPSPSPSFTELEDPIHW